MKKRNRDVLQPVPSREESITETGGFDPVTGKRLRRIKRLLGKKILVRKCFNDHIRDSSGKILVLLTDKQREKTHWNEIRVVGSECKEFTRKDVGAFILGPELTDGMYGIGNSMWIYDEKLVDRGHIKPFIVPVGDSI